MRQDKVIFVIPGFRQKTTSNAYKTLAKVLKSEGYYPVLVRIPWRNSTISQNSDYFLNKFKKYEAKKTYVLGFSYGAMIAFIASTFVKTDGLILCSLSPYFKEDVSLSQKKSVSTLTKLRLKDFAKHSCSRLAQETKARQIVILYGTEEATSLIRRATRAFNQIQKRKKYIIPILKTEHNIGDKKYLQTIELAARAIG